MVEIPFREEVFAIVGAAIDVHRQLGPGFLESVYHEAMEIEPTSRCIQFQSQVCLPVYYKGQRLTKSFVADRVCFGKVIVEQKAMDAVSGTEEAQIHNYLRATGLHVVVLINFGSQGKLEWKRWVL